jgi:hypothetical protein
MPVLFYFLVNTQCKIENLTPQDATYHGYVFLKEKILRDYYKPWLQRSQLSAGLTFPEKFWTYLICSSVSTLIFSLFTTSGTYYQLHNNTRKFSYHLSYIRNLNIGNNDQLPSQ